jgi:GNAT superfamily N-acetyltransferase
MGVLRQATIDDIAGMHHVRVAVRENRLSDPGRITPSDYAAAIESLGRGWVAEVDGEIVAFAVGYASGNIWALFVHPDHEGRGHGRALHAQMVDWLWSLGLGRLWLTTAPGSRAEGFYRSLGWHPQGNAGGDVRMGLTRP